MSQDGSGMYIRQIDRSLQLQKDQKELSKLQNQNVQMITVPQGMTVLQNPLNISQVPTMLGQPNGQVYMIPTNQNLVQGGIPQGLIGQQMLPGQNLVMQQNQLGMPGGMQYNVPLMQMNMPHNSQYMPGLNLNSQLTAQQLNAALAGHQLQLPGQHLGTIPIVQQSGSPITNPQNQPVHQLLPQSFMTPNSQFATMPQQYMMPNSGMTVPPNPVQYTLPTPTAPNNNGNGNGNENNSEGESSGNGQANYITSSSQEGTQTFTTDGSTTQTTLMQPNPSVTPSYGTNGGTSTPTNLPYTNQTVVQTSSYPTNGSSESTGNYATTPATSTPQTFSPSTTPAPQNYPASVPTMPMAFPPNQNPYPNATGQNLAAYASNQYQYTSRPWFRPRYGSPQGSPSPYNAGAGAPPGGPPMPVPPPAGNYNYWQDS